MVTKNNKIGVKLFNLLKLIDKSIFSNLRATLRRFLLTLPPVKKIHESLNTPIYGENNQSSFDYGEIIGVPVNDKLPHILVVAHEAARTGAPILALNLIWKLKHTHNVTVLLLDKNGPLLSDFIASGAHMIYAVNVRGNVEDAHRILNYIIKNNRFELAIVNSIESSLHVLPILAKHQIFSINLIHEFSSCYANAKQMWRFMTDWPGEFVFSSKLTMEDAFLFAPVTIKERACVIPQGVCQLPLTNSGSSEDAFERDALRGLLRPSHLGDEVVLVVGMGSIHLRKGVDLFIQAAAEIKKLDPESQYRFVWVGKSYEGGLNWGYDTFLRDQIRRSELSDDLIIIDDTKYLDVVYGQMNFFLLTSRLDPLPNVAIDAFSWGVPVLCFDATTGIAEYLKQGGVGDLCVSHYLDTKHMAEQLVCLNTKLDLKNFVKNKVKNITEQQFNFEKYISKLRDLQLSQDAASLKALNIINYENESLVDKDFFISRQFLRDIVSYIPNNFDFNDVSELYLYAWRNTHLRRKPVRGFHPGIYLEEHNFQIEIDPYAHYLATHKPIGPWTNNIICGRGESIKISDISPVALHIHTFYPELLSDILDRVLLNQIKPDIFLTVIDEEVARKVEKIVSGYSEIKVNISVVENRGRNFMPLFKTIGPLVASQYKYVGHLHTKMSPHADKDLINDWRSYLLESLVGGYRGGAMMDRVISHMHQNENVALVFPDDPNVIGWDANLPFAREIAKKYGITNLKTFFNFPVGGMFWIQGALLEKFKDLDDLYFPPEPLPIDGSYLHALERLIPAIIESQGYKVSLATANGLSR